MAIVAIKLFVITGLENSDGANSATFTGGARQGLSFLDENIITGHCSSNLMPDDLMVLASTSDRFFFG